MGQVLHKRAATTHEVRAAIQRSSASIKKLAARYGINPKTVQKWRRRDGVEDAPMGAKRPPTVLSEQDEAIICAFRTKTRLPLDDCFLALKDETPRLTRSNLHRCLRTCKFVYAELHASASARTAARFMRNLALAIPYRVHTVLTDNGVQFTYRLLAKPPRNRTHPFDEICADLKIEHRLTQVGHPWTNGQVERMNRTLKEATVASFHYATHAQLKRHLHDFLNAYNHARKLKALKWRTPVETIIKTHDAKPDIFHSDQPALIRTHSGDY